MNLVRFDATNVEYIYRIVQDTVSACIDRNGDYWWTVPTPKALYKLPRKPHTLPSFTDDFAAPITDDAGTRVRFANGAGTYQVRCFG